jgi:hypothetical protein
MSFELNELVILNGRLCQVKEERDCSQCFIDNYAIDTEKDCLCYHYNQNIHFEKFTNEQIKFELYSEQKEKEIKYALRTLEIVIADKIKFETKATIDFETKKYKYTRKDGKYKVLKDGKYVDLKVKTFKKSQEVCNG